MASMPRVVLIMAQECGYERGLLRGIARYARHHGPWAFFLAGEHPEIPLPNLHNGPLLPRPSRRGLPRTGRLDLKRLGATGILGRLHTPALTETVLASGLPVIAMDLTDAQRAAGSPLRRVSEILPDSRQAGRLVAEHFLDRGFRRFAFCGYAEANWSRWREEGFAARLREAGFGYESFPSSDRLPGHRTPSRVIAWLRSLVPPVGLMTCNDSWGRQVLEACALGGLQVPAEVAVVGVDEDHLLSELSTPSLSSVQFNTEQSGYRAAELLAAMMQGHRTPRQEIVVEPLWVVPRTSSDIVALEDRDVAQAVQYIREHAREPALNVRTIVAHTAVSRRALEIRFQRSLGRSIRAEVERVRLGWAKQLLLETNLPIGKVANGAGFSSSHYLSRVFRRVTATTLAAFRRGHLPP